eukprot:1217981-Rhodomonas_salina.2
MSKILERFITFFTSSQAGTPGTPGTTVSAVVGFLLERNFSYEELYCYELLPVAHSSVALAVMHSRNPVHRQFLSLMMMTSPSRDRRDLPPVSIPLSCVLLSVSPFVSAPPCPALRFPLVTSLARTRNSKISR